MQNGILTINTRQTVLRRIDPKKEERIKSFRRQYAPKLSERPNTYCSASHDIFQQQTESNNPQQSLPNTNKLPSLHKSCKPSQLPKPSSTLSPLHNSLNPFFEKFDERMINDPDCF